MTLKQLVEARACHRQRQQGSRSSSDGNCYKHACIFRKLIPIRVPCARFLTAQESLYPFARC
ncbi:hypothetical protein PZN02_006047 (plasmid) [Sinorhizobium garamanticum]|uniref:Uncharacterized protein n=1 Tax=Sinorhizobium garamanticum TaxID=680247 RepID=A0ABY8DP71_9HYPH|nr:hypothetical protein [Sinorhizobium garamanticum]WEX91737.1 hypothetical protein PZN02_006047 [Sinorhizobium garamanticum]